MNVLAIDSADNRGSVALRRGGETVAVVRHEVGADYSSRLLPSVTGILASADLTLAGVDVLAVCTGPGSFTGVRVGLTTVKAWAEVCGKGVVGLSRLEAMASRTAGQGLVAACYDAHRGHVFGALYRRQGTRLTAVEADMVVAPAEFLLAVAGRAGAEPVRWISLDPEQVTGLEGWRARAGVGDSIELCAPDLASTIAEVGEVRAASGEFVDPLVLDANYVRRSDAEIFWKGR